MDPITQQTVLAAAGAGGGKVYVDDVFSTFLYDGTGSSQSINNGIDLAGEGGLVWIKGRGPTGWQNVLTDTERGAGKHLECNNAGAEEAAANTVPSFSSTGFATGSDNQVNYASETSGYVSWTFRKAPGFFDVVTYTGNGVTGRTVSHNLGSKPGMIIIKDRDSNYQWGCYHQSMGATKKAYFNGDSLFGTDASWWNNTEPTSTVFTLGQEVQANKDGHNFVAYIFAHDEPVFGSNEDESIIKCGSFTSLQFGQQVDINLGFEPQFFLVKKSNGTGDWYIIDTMRGFHADVASGPQNRVLRANEANNEGAEEYWRPTATGIKGFPTGNSATYIYMAIRRPNKPPTAATEVYKTVQNNTTLINGTVVDFGFTPDMHIASRTTTGMAHWITSRLTGGRYMFTSSSSNEGNTLSSYNKGQTIVKYTGTAANDTGTYLHHGFKRAPGFFDVVKYTGKSDTAGLSVTHNLGVVPELVFFKRRDYTKNWYTYSSVTGTQKVLYLDSDLAAASDNDFIPTTPTSTELTVNSYYQIFNQDSLYIAYLFATLPGISKVGSYSGTGNAVNVDCGFTNGARFILIKRTDGSGNIGDWYVWDSVRGIVSGNDPYLLLNTADNQVTNTDYIDPLSTGFTVTASAPAALNVSGGTYLFLAIA